MITNLLFKKKNKMVFQKQIENKISNNNKKIKIRIKIYYFTCFTYLF